MAWPVNFLVSNLERESGESGVQGGFVNFFVAILERGLRESGFRGVRAPFLEHPILSFEV